MFNYGAMIKRAIEFFPQWTDIRKRYKTSVGGRFLSSIVEESIKTEEAIQEYIDSYFLYNYIGHEDEVMAFVYMAHVGDLELFDYNLIQVFYNNKTFTQTKDLADFESHPDKFFYENGRIYLKESSIVEDNLTMTLVLDEQSSDYKLVRTHVWNIFDEFATFVNTRRYENETNKELLDRILYITKNLPNSTEAGLKHAIISELMTDFPNISEDDIVIERPTPENLIKPYEDYETLLDLLADVNRDIYRSKRWDLDYWEYDFESISYIPHVWDKVVKDWQNGVGSYNDLEVILADKNDITDASIYFYKKTLEAFQKYIYDKYIENDIHFTLTKYENILNKTNIKYKITASELKDITTEDIKLKIYESKKRKTEIPVQQISSGWGKDISKLDKNVIEDLSNYKLNFKSKTGYDLIISKANVIYTNQTTGEVVEVRDLMEEKPGFILNSEYELVSEANEIKIDAVEHFTEYEGLMNEDGRITLDTRANEGYAALSLTNKAGLYVNFDYDCNTVSMPNSLISSPGGYWNYNDEYVLRGDYSTESKVVTFSILANYVSFDISDENINAIINMTVDDEIFGTNEYDISSELNFETEKTDIPRRITFTINVLSINDVKFKNFRYSNYSIEFSTRYGELEKTEKGYKLSNFYKNELRVRLTAKTGCSPYINVICIGRDFKNISYKTAVIPYRNACIRSFEIVTNGVMDLIKLDDNLYETNDVIENYKPITEYTGTSDSAYLRIDLSDYESIEKIELPTGTLELIEESGVTYYNIRLTTGQTIDSIIVTGTKNIEAREVPLIDMIKFYMPDFNSIYDKIYCSKCSKGLIIGRQNPGGTPYNVLITIKSDAFIGINATQYEMKIPTDLGTVYGSNNGTEHRMNSIKSSFDYISLYPTKAQIYTAINSYDTYIKTNKNIPITNNFSPVLDTSKLLFYSIELYDESLKENVVIRFHSEVTADLNIYDMPSWSIGTSNTLVAIQNNIDLLNDISYKVSSYNIDEVNQLSSTIDIKDTYELTDHTILNTEKFIVQADNDNISIKYDYYDGTNKKAHLLKYEEVIVGSSGFNKLVYSNIDTIYHISRSKYEDKYLSEITDYELLKDEGIIIWHDDALIENNIKVYLIYSIRKPTAFVFDLDYLYKAIDYDVDAYEEVSTHEISGIKSGEYIDFMNDPYHPSILKDYDEKQPDLIFVSCSEPTFEAKYENNCITFNKYIENNTLLVKTGYYYINGREYYLFSETSEDEIKNNALYESKNIDISGGEITTYKPTNNYVSNSEMRLKGIAELYNFDCTKPLTYGVSSFNSLTSCDSFNDWTTFGMNLKLAEGLNGLALKFEQEIENGYSFIDITDSLVDGINYVSFYASEDLKTYLGVEEKYLYINFNRALNITIDKEITQDGSNIRYTTIDKSSNNIRYYLIVASSGIIDDIVISNELNSIYESHTKNISLLGFNLYEKKPQGSQYKMALKTHKDYKPYMAGLMSDGSIKTTSSIDWYVTQIFNCDKDEDFRQCKLKNIGVDSNYIYTQSQIGYIETMPMFIGDIDNIKRLIFKINNINFDNMKNFTTTIYISDRYNGEYIPYKPYMSNRFYINQEYLNNYIKVKIEVPPYKYIDNISIFAEYISSNEDPLKIVTKQSGYIESKVYDLQEITNCMVKSIDIDGIGNINDVDIFIRCSKDEERLDIWSDWYRIQLDDNIKIKNRVLLDNTRFLQFKVVLKNREAYIKLKGINIEIR